MNIYIDRIEFSSADRAAVYLRTGVGSHVAYLTVCKDSDGCKSIEQVDEWFFSILFICRLVRKFSDDLFMAYNDQKIDFPLSYPVTKFTDLNAVVHDLKPDISTSEVERRYRVAEG
jgi:hypothetical protein